MMPLSTPTTRATVNRDRDRCVRGVRQSSLMRAPLSWLCCWPTRSCRPRLWDMWAASRSLLLEAHLFERRRPRVGVDQHQRGLLHPGPDSRRPDVFPDGREPHPLVDDLLDLVQQRLALAAIGHEGLLLVQRVDVEIA